MVKRRYSAEAGVGVKLSDIQCLPKDDLLVLIHQVEEAVVRGTAQMRDYETFVRCQKELLRREFFHFERDKASKP